MRGLGRGQCIVSRQTMWGIGGGGGGGVGEGLGLVEAGGIFGECECGLV